MRFRIMALALLASLLAISIGSAADAKAVNWKAGAAKIKITPERPMWLSGYSSRTKPAEGKLTDLWAKALILEDPKGRQALLVTMDLVGIDRKLSIAICEELKKRYHFERSSIILSVSHTHSGPVVHNNLEPMYFLDLVQQQLVVDYARTLQGKIIAVVGEASSRVAPARIEWGTGKATFAVNRRNNSEPAVPRLREAGLLRGPVDHEVPVLCIRDPEGHVRAVVCGYACHATVLSLDLWCGDYPGYAQLDLEKGYPGAIAMFWAGCGGDQNPLPRRSVSQAEEYGHQLAESVEAVVRAPMTPITGRLSSIYSEIELPFADLPSRDQIVKDSTSSNRYVAARAKLLLHQLEQKGSLIKTYPYPIQVWGLGQDLLLIALGGETVVDYSLRLKKEIGPGHTWVAGYTNDVMAYIPSLRVLNEGGYEGASAMIYYGLPTVWGPRIEELLVAGVHDLVKQLTGPAKGARTAVR